MRVLIVAQHYHPEVTAAVNRLTALTEALQRNGHQAVVIAPKPNHPAGVIAQDFRGPLVLVRQVMGAEVHYVWVYTSPKKSLLRRLMYYTTFMVLAIGAACGIKGSFDVVFASSPPPLVGIAGWLIARIKRARFVFDVRDLWPGLAIALGELKNPVAIAAARAVESQCYRSADAIVAVTRSFQAEIARRTKGRVPVELIPNGALPLFLDAGAHRNAARTARGWDGRYVVSYIGNVGVCQGLMHLVEAAALLRETSPEVLLFIQGHGVVKPRLIQAARDRGLTNLEFADSVQLEIAADAMAASDALLVPLAAAPMVEQFIPSKLFDSMATGRPVLLSVPGEAQQILTAAQAGISYHAEDGEALAGAIRALQSNLAAADAMGHRGREFVRERFMRTDLSDRAVAFLLRVSSAGAAAGRTSQLS